MLGGLSDGFLIVIGIVLSCLGVRVEVWISCGILRSAHVDTHSMSISL